MVGRAIGRVDSTGNFIPVTHVLDSAHSPPPPHVDVLCAVWSLTHTLFHSLLCCGSTCYVKTLNHKYATVLHMSVFIADKRTQYNRQRHQGSFVSIFVNRFKLILRHFGYKNYRQRCRLNVTKDVKESSLIFNSILTLL